MDRSLSGIFLLAILPFLPGCYTYQSVSSAQLREGMEVRASLSAEYAESLSDVLPAGRRILQGRVEDIGGSGGDELLLAVPVAAEQNGVVGSRLQQRVSLRFSEIFEVEQRQLDQTRSLLLAGGVIAVVSAIVVRQVTQGGSGKTDQVGGPKPVEVRQPAFGIRLPIGRP